MTGSLAAVVSAVEDAQARQVIDTSHALAMLRQLEADNAGHPLVTQLVRPARLRTMRIQAERWSQR